MTGTVEVPRPVPHIVTRRRKEAVRDTFVDVQERSVNIGVTLYIVKPRGASETLEVRHHALNGSRTAHTHWHRSVFARACKHARTKAKRHTHEQIHTDAYTRPTIACTRRRSRKVALMHARTQTHTSLLLRLTATQANWPLMR